jgi:hypothetical protein
MLTRLKAGQTSGLRAERSTLTTSRGLEPLPSRLAVASATRRQVTNDTVRGDLLIRDERPDRWPLRSWIVLEHVLADEVNAAILEN